MILRVSQHVVHFVEHLGQGLPYVAVLVVLQQQHLLGHVLLAELGHLVCERGNYINLGY